MQEYPIKETKPLMYYSIDICILNPFNQDT